MGPAPITEVAEVLGLSRTTLTRSADVLEQNGWIEEGPSDDGRVRALQLTDEGRRKIEDAFAAWKEAQDLIDRREDREAAEHRASSTEP